MATINWINSYYTYKLGLRWIVADDIVLQADERERREKGPIG